MQIDHEIASRKFRLLGLRTDSLEAREIYREILDLQDQKVRLVYNHRPAR
jgi:hypothetical protein